jgi:predicted RNase H-like nuclease (RuvC/YqgF family)
VIDHDLKHPIMIDVSDPTLPIKRKKIQIQNQNMNRTLEVYKKKIEEQNKEIEELNKEIQDLKGKIQTLKSENFNLELKFSQMDSPRSNMSEE